jgi:hypothetical protein
MKPNKNNDMFVTEMIGMTNPIIKIPNISFSHLHINPPRIPAGVLRVHDTEELIVEPSENAVLVWDTEDYEET